MGEGRWIVSIPGILAVGLLTLILSTPVTRLILLLRPVTAEALAVLLGPMIGGLLADIGLLAFLPNAPLTNFLSPKPGTATLVGVVLGIAMLYLFASGHPVAGLGG